MLHLGCPFRASQHNKCICRKSAIIAYRTSRAKPCLAVCLCLRKSAQQPSCISNALKSPCQTSHKLHAA